MLFDDKMHHVFGKKLLFSIHTGANFGISLKRLFAQVLPCSHRLKVRQVHDDASNEAVATRFKMSWETVSP